jgi:hypothetical protein
MSVSMIAPRKPMTAATALAITSPRLRGEVGEPVSEMGFLAPEN